MRYGTKVNVMVVNEPYGRNQCESSAELTKMICIHMPHRKSLVCPLGLYGVSGAISMGARGCYHKKTTLMSSFKSMMNANHQ